MEERMRKWEGGMSRGHRAEGRGQRAEGRGFRRGKAEKLNTKP
jgi:hypothetical protein